MKILLENILALTCLSVFSVAFSNLGGCAITQYEILQAEQSFGRTQAYIVADEIAKNIETPRENLFFYSSKLAAEDYLEGNFPSLKSNN